VPYLLAHVTVAESEPFLQRQAERRAVDLALLGFLGVKLPWQALPAGAGTDGRRKELPMAKEDVKIGGFCGGACVKECGATFGEALWQACRTCPN
jgi:hypothetical protein